MDLAKSGINRQAFLYLGGAQTFSWISPSQGCESHSKLTPARTRVCNFLENCQLKTKLYPCHFLPRTALGKASMKTYRNNFKGREKTKKYSTLHLLLLATAARMLCAVGTGGLDLFYSLNLYQRTS